MAAPKPVADPAAVLPIFSMPGHLVRRLHQISAAIFMEETREFDITPVQYAALQAIATNPGLEQVTLSGFIAYDRTTIGGVAERLEEKGLIERRIADRDRRARNLYLTEAGQRLLDALAPAVARVQERIVAPLGAAERRSFMTLLAKLVDVNNGLSRAPARPIE